MFCVKNTILEKWVLSSGFLFFIPSKKKIKQISVTRTSKKQDLRKEPQVQTGKQPPKLKLNLPKHSSP